MTTSSSNHRIIREGSERPVETFALPVMPLVLPGEAGKPSLRPEVQKKKDTDSKKAAALKKGDDKKQAAALKSSKAKGKQALPVSERDESVEARKQIVEAAKREAAQIMEKAFSSAGRIEDEARRAADETREQARKEGYDTGFEKGLQQGEQQARLEFEQEIERRLKEFEDQMEAALASVEEAKEHCMRKYMDDLLDCSVAVAEKVIHVSLRSSGEVIKRMITAATEKLKKTAWVKIYISKFDYNMMMKADADVAEELSRLSDNIKFIVMDQENEGNCIIEMPEEIVDVSVNTQLENIKDILENVKL